MCGIVGFSTPKANFNSFPEKVLSMLASIEHRGPDEFGYFFDTETCIGNARLSIIAPESGQQPISDIRKRFWISYNGEVYNYIELREQLKIFGVNFKTNSDTEVVLQTFIKWGIPGFNRLNGNFAFTIYDTLEKKLYLVRDRYGQRPLYYSQNGHSLYFSSEIKAFYQCPEVRIRISKKDLHSIYKTWGNLPEQSVFENIKQIPTGACLTFQTGVTSIEYYYNLEKWPEKHFNGDHKDLVTQSKHLLRESVKSRLRSDTKVGSYLSGGIDSCITTAIAQEIVGKPIQSYGICFEEKKYDESFYQNEAVKKIKSRHSQIHVTNYDIVKNLPVTIWHTEQPIFRTAAVPMFLLSKRVNEDGIKVVLTGEGADETHLGYNIFKETFIRMKWCNLNSFEREEAILSLYPYLHHFNKKNIKALVAQFENSIDDTNSLFFSHELRFRNSVLSQLLLTQEKHFENEFSTYLSSKRDLLEKLNPIEKAQVLEFTTLLQGYLLSSQGDRVSLANSVENRAPFLDYKLVEFLKSVPYEFKLSKKLDEKLLLKQGFNDVVPKSVLNRTKQPYRSPDILPFRENWNKTDYLDLILSEKELKKSLLFNEKKVFMLTKLIKNKPIDSISAALSQSFIFLLTTRILEHSLQNLDYKKSHHLPPIKIKVDGTQVY